MEEIEVRIRKPSDRRYFQMLYVDPLTGKKVTRSTKTENRREAERAAAKWEAELREGRYKPASKMSWDEFRERYEDEVLASLAEETDHKSQTVFGMLEQRINPQKLRDLTSDKLSQFQAALRDGTRSEDTIDGYLRHLKAALNWAVTMGLIHETPAIQRPRRRRKSKGMKGRPITVEEFERMLAVVDKDFDEEIAGSWKYLLNGLWHSGLRLGESLELWWDRDDRLMVVMEGKHPTLRIPGTHEKGNTDRLLPMAPEFAEFLGNTPVTERTGRVFAPEPRQKEKGGNRMGLNYVSRSISAIGKTANVKVHTYESGRVKFASAHDLRRSFGDRWATRVMPPVLQQLMRHESIETTMKYYVGRSADQTASILWAAHQKVAGNTFGNSQPNPPDSADRSIDASS